MLVPFYGASNQKKPLIRKRRMVQFWKKKQKKVLLRERKMLELRIVWGYNLANSKMNLGLLKLYKENNYGYV